MGGIKKEWKNDDADDDDKNSKVIERNQKSNKFSRQRESEKE